MFTKSFSILYLMLFIFALPHCVYFSKGKHCGHHEKGHCGSKSRNCKSKKGDCKKPCCSNSHMGKAQINPVQGKVRGEVVFKQEKGEKKDRKRSTRVEATIKGLAPNQKFGFHVHEYGDCSDKALKAGGHFDPKWFHKKRSKDKPAQHGGPSSEHRHLGDLGNISSNQKGVAQYSAVIPGRVKMFFGRSVVVHAKEDDLKSQPTGNSGDRIGCGVIGVTLDDSVQKEPAPKK